MSDQLKAQLETDFATDFREGEAMAREWISGRGDLPELMLIIRDMPRELGGLEAGFLSHIDAAVRGDQRGPRLARQIRRRRNWRWRRHRRRRCPPSTWASSCAVGESKLCASASTSSGA